MKQKVGYSFWMSIAWFGIRNFCQRTRENVRAEQTTKSDSILRCSWEVELHIWHMIGYLSHADWAGVEFRKSMVSFVTSLPYSVILCMTVIDMLVFIHYMSEDDIPIAILIWEDITWNTEALILLKNYNHYICILWFIVQISVEWFESNHNSLQSNPYQTNSLLNPQEQIKAIQTIR